MKNTFKYLLLLGAMAFGFASCQKEEADVKGVVGDFVYIVDGTEALYKAPTCEVFHTPIGEQGTVAATVKVALTKAQESDVNVVLALDDASVMEKYNAFPAGVVKFNKNVTIPAGEMEASVEVTVDNADFAKLVELQYQAVIRIAETSALQISSNSNVAYMMAVTETIDPADNIIMVKESVSEYEIKHYTDGTVTTDLSKTITISGSEEAFLPFDITLAVDNDLIAAYNEANGTTYKALPSDVTLNFSEVVMEKEATSVRATMSISEEDQKKMTDVNGYLIPVVVADAGDATIADNCGVTYLAVRVANIDSSMNFFSALYLGDYRMATWFKFDKPMVFQPNPDANAGYTYIFHVYLDEITRVARIGNFADASENWINMLRFGQKGNYDTRLEWWVGPNNHRKQLYAPAIEAGKWYQYALVYTGSSFIMYLNCVEVDRIDLTAEEKEFYNNQRCEFQAIEFNSSWGTNYRQGNELHGRLSNLVVWNYGLGANRIKQCYGGVDADRSYYMEANQWGAWWKMDEGYGHVLRQTLGVPMGDIDFSKSVRCDDEVHMVDADVSAYVQWKADSANEWPPIEENAPVIE